jgi:hypothetical protein
MEPLPRRLGPRRRRPRQAFEHGDERVGLGGIGSEDVVQLLEEGQAGGLPLHDHGHDHRPAVAFG